MKIGIIGGGAAGLMAALSACENGSEVTILEHKEIVGKKINATGNGRCNYTNLRMDESCYRGDLELLQAPFAVLSNMQLIEKLKSYGIYPKDRNGYVYPYSETATSVRKALEMACKRSGCEIITSVVVLDVVVLKDGFEVKTSQGLFVFDRIIVSTGLKATPHLGSDGSFFPILNKLGHHMTDLYPALIGFEAEGMPFDAIAGVRAEAKATLLVDHALVRQDQGEIQFTEYGLSGIPIFQLSSDGVRALAQGKKAQIVLDFFPDMTEDALITYMQFRREAFDATTKVGDFFHGLLNPKLANGILSIYRISQKTKLSDLQEDLFLSLCKLLKQVTVELKACRDFDQAQVCTGGILTSEVKMDSLESQLIPGLFFAGELLNIDGKCGGYNLQWAFSSGYLAGIEASK